MAITADWPSGVFTVPKADTTLVSIGPPEIREFDVNDLRTAMRVLGASEAGMPWPESHFNTGEYTLSGFVYARGFGIINNYSVTFEDGQYTVNLFGANHNIADVKNANQVSIAVQNSGGLLVGDGGGGTTAAEVWEHPVEGGWTAEQLLRLLAAVMAGKTSIVDTPGTGATITFRDVNDTKERLSATMDGSRRTGVTLDLT